MIRCESLMLFEIFRAYVFFSNSSAMQQFTDRAWVLAHKAQSANCYMSGAPSHEIKDEPQSGAGCEADAFMNVRAELLLFLNLFIKIL